ncbi:MAG: secondary thiamine-phosphate synthase enzyme YjbQ [Lachnospiraceae bacterium]|nr:secondary thiamine-phosphate synthase enzyme YjbQ [Lachnospiraceae bacterium]
MVKLNSFVLHTTTYNDFINITKEVEEQVAASGIKDGVAFIITGHTTTAIMVNEALECLQSDMMEMMWRLVPEDAPYSHARMLHSYGTTAGNPTGHLRSMLTGNHTVFPVKDGKIIRGNAQEIFFCEFDGAQSRTVYVQVIG